MNCKANTALVTGCFLFLATAVFSCEKQSDDQDAKSVSAVAMAKNKKIDDGKHKRIVQSLHQLEDKAVQLMKGGDLTAAKQLIDKGIKQTEASRGKLDNERGRLLLLLGNLERDKGNEIEARRHAADAMALFMVQKNIEGQFRVRLTIATLEENLGDQAAAYRQLDEAEQMLPKIAHNKEFEAEYLMHKGRLFARQMKYDEAMTAFLKASRIFSENNKQAQADALMSLAVAEDANNNVKQCRLSLEKALKIYRKIENKDGEVKVLHKMAALAERDKQYRKARILFKKTAELYAQLNRSSDETKVKRHINALPEPQKKKK